jgi:hypothetical protein
MFLQGAAEQSAQFADAEEAARQHAFVPCFCLHFGKPVKHLLAKFVTILGRINVKQAAVQPGHGLDRLSRHAEAGDFGEVLHAADFQLEVAASPGSEPIGLAAARAVFLFEALDPVVFEKAPQSAVKRAGAQDDAAIAHFLDIFEDGIAVAGLFEQAEKDEEHGFGEGEGVHISSSDMSLNAILNGVDPACQEKN